MDAERLALARTCLDAAHDGSLGFPEIAGRLIAAGFDGYTVDYRADRQTYYLPDGDSVSLDLPETPGAIAGPFDADAIAGLVRWAQENGPDYSYVAFSSRVKQAGCAGYIVSFPGRRIVYFGRTAETHVEHFPS